MTDLCKHCGRERMDDTHSGWTLATGAFPDGHHGFAMRPQDHSQDRIQVISSDPRAKDLVLKVVGQWGKDNA